jgi:hypothetical protein
MKTPVAATRARSAGKGRRPRDVQDWDRGEQRRPRDVADEHRSPRADARGNRTAPEAEDADWQYLGDDHPRHLLRRAGRAQDEPRQREPGHLRAERGDHLGGEERRDAPVAQEAHDSAAAPNETTIVRAPRRSRSRKSSSSCSNRSPSSSSSAGVSNYSFESQPSSTCCSFSRASPAGGSSGASPPCTHSSVSRTVSSSGRWRSPAAVARSAGVSCIAR